MKKISYLLFSAILGALLLFALVSCGECDHTYGEWITDRKASESVVGERHRECTKCGEKETEVIPKLPHTHTYATEWSKDDTYHWHASTCGHVTEVAEKATHTYENGSCTVCGAKEPAAPPAEHTHTYAEEWSKDDLYHWHASTCGHVTEISGKAEHTFGDWIIDREASETEAGAKHRICMVCDKEETAEIAKLPHTHKYAEAWSKDDLYHWHASTCGHASEVSEKAEHTYENGACTVCGAEESVTPPAHTHTYAEEWSKDDTYHWHASTCGHETEISGKAEHTYGDWIVDREATEELVGAKHRICTVCGKEETAEIAKLPHTHKYAEAWSKDDLYHWHASTCGHETEISGKEEHTFGEWIIDREATEELVGARHRVCTVCGKEETAEIEKLPHTHKYAEAWSKDDTYHWHASTCGHETEISCKAEHTYGEWIIDREATEESVGTKHRVCTVCGKEETAEIEKLPHTHKYAAEWSKDDNYHWHASACGHETEVSGKAEHTYENEVCTICGMISPMSADSLEYTISEDEASYVVTGIGGFKGRDLIIPEAHKGLPVTSIGDSAFYGCTGLTSITIPNSVQSIGSSAFYWCTNLEIVTFAENSQCSSIGDDAFHYCTGLTSVTIPNSVTNIGYSAFSSCTGLMSITIPFVGETKDGTDNTHFGYIFGTYSSSGNKYCVPSTLKNVVITGGMSIDNGAFAYCTALTGITIPNSVTSIGNSAFAGCTGITSITIPNSVMNIGGYAFAWCTVLKTVTFAENSQCASIGSSAFEGCTGLTSIEIPNSVTSIESRAFYGCTNLKTVTFAENSQCASIGICAFYYCTELTSIEVPDSVTSIGNSAFSSCTGLTSVTIGTGVTSIGERAFEYCTGLTSVTIPNSVTTISAFAFEHCTGLTSIVIPDSVTSIGNYAFSDCAELTIVTIGNGVKSIGQEAFKGCIELMSVTIGTSVTYIGYGAFIDCAKLIEVVNHSSLNITAGSEDYGYIGYYAECIITDAKDSYLSADENGYIFYDDGSNVYLIGYEGTATELVLPKASTTGKTYGIYPYAFYGCDKLTSITIPNSVTSIGEAAFYGCTGLSIITVPSSVTSIGDFAFSSCTGLTSITVESGNQRYHSAGNCLIETETKTLIFGCKNSVIPTDGSVTSIGVFAFSGCTGLTGITIPNSVTNIGDSAFEGCTGLTCITIPNSVEDIGRSTFAGCTGLTGITIPNSVTSIGWYAFYECTNLKVVTFAENSQCTSIGDGAFFGCTELTSVTIPNSVTYIGDQAFWGCYKLIEVVNYSFLDIAAGSEDCGYIGYYAKHIITDEKDSYLTTDENGYIFYDDGSNVYLVGYAGTDTELVLPKASPSGKAYGIYPYAFYKRYELANITIPGSVQSIGEYAFYRCTNLKTVTFAENSTCSSIGESAFYYCTRLTSITIPNSVTSIGNSAFEGCTGLTSITIPNSAQNIGDSAFARCTNLKTVTFAENSQCASIGIYAFYLCTELTSITIPNSVTSIGEFVFDGCTNLKDIYYTGTQSEWGAISKGRYVNNFAWYYTIHYADEE